MLLLSFSAIDTFEIRDAYFGKVCKRLRYMHRYFSVMLLMANTCQLAPSTITELKKKHIKLLLNKYFSDVDI